MSRYPTKRCNNYPRCHEFNVKLFLHSADPSSVKVLTTLFYPLFIPSSGRTELNPLRNGLQIRRLVDPRFRKKHQLEGNQQNLERSRAVEIVWKGSNNRRGGYDHRTDQTLVWLVQHQVRFRLKWSVKKLIYSAPTCFKSARAHTTKISRSKTRP